MKLPPVEIPPLQSSDSAPKTPLKTPKTPADEGIAFFESLILPGEGPVRVFELQLDPDGGPSKDKAVRTYFSSLWGDLVYSLI